MRKLLMLALISFFINISYAQKTELKSSYAVTTISMEDLGKYEVIWPRGLKPGDLITAGIRQLPAGDKEKLVNKNREALSSNNLTIGDKTVSGNQNNIQIRITPDLIKEIPVRVTSASGKQLFEKGINFLGENPFPASNVFNFPTHGLASSPFFIIGPFDGNSSNTSCIIGGKPATVLAETPRQCIIEFPANVKGPATIELNENGIIVNEKIGVVDYTLSTGRLNLKKGESTWVEVAITGLNHLEENATLTVSNLTTGVVAMADGDLQVIQVMPSSVTGAGTLTKRFNLQSLQTGSFSVNVNLDLPGPRASAPAKNWIACNLGVTTCILPGSTCSKLQSGLAQRLNFEPLLQLNPPDENPFYYSPLKTGFDGKYLVTSVQHPSHSGGQPIESMSFTYSMLSIDKPQTKKEILIDRISGIDINEFSSQVPVHQLTPGLYNIRATGQFGENQSYTQSSFVIIPGKRNPPAVTNSEIEKLRREEQRLRDSINAMNRRIENGNQQLNENYRRRRYLDSLRIIQLGLYNQLHRIDALIEQIPGIYGPQLQALLDSLNRFKQKAGSLNEEELKQAEDRLQQEADELEAALNACRQHLAALQQEQQDLQNEKQRIQAEQEQAYRDILDACRAAGYNAGGGSGHNRVTGEFKYNYGLILRGAGGEMEYVRGVPAGALKKIGELEKKIKDGNSRIREINARQKELPGEMENTKNECDDLAAQLARAKEALRKGKNAVIEYNYNMADLDELCSEIKKLLEPLDNWCSLHPGECVSFQSQLKQLMEDCPANLQALPDLMNNLGNIINQKKQVEQQHKSRADDLGRQIDAIDRQNQDIGNGIWNDTEKAGTYGDALANTMREEDRAIMAELAKQQAAADAAKAHRKRTCIEFLKGLGAGESANEGGLLALMEAIKEQVQDIGGKIGDGLGAVSELTDEKTKEKIEAVNESIEKMLEPLEKYDEYKEYVEELKDIKEKLETLLSGDETPEGRAKSFGATLGLLKKALDKIAEKVPILQFFTAYFGYLVDGYNAAVEGTYNIFRKRFKEIAESAIAKTDCQLLMNEYLKRNSLDDVYRKAYELCEGGIYGDVRSAEMRRLFQEAVNQAALKKLIDCCLKWSSE